MALQMTNSSVNVSHFQHAQHCYSRQSKSHRNHSAARARGCRVFPVRCQTSVSRRERCEQKRPSWLAGCVSDPEIALVMVPGTLRAAGCTDGIRFRAQITPLECSLCVTMTARVCATYREATVNVTVRRNKTSSSPSLIERLM